MNKSLLLIDPQNDFCSSKGSLFVPGAEEDAVRLATFIKNNNAALASIYVTLDCHPYYHIAHANFWRDKNGVEIDLLSKKISENIEETYAWEIKSGSTYSEDYFKNLKSWSKFSGVAPENCRVIYTGQTLMKTSNGTLIPWMNCTV